MVSTQLTLPTAVLLMCIVCSSAKSFQATCTVNDTGNARSGGAPRRPAHSTKSAGPSFYGASGGSLDVNIEAAANDLVTIYVNGETSADWATKNCKEYLSVPYTLHGGEVISFVAENTNGVENGLYAAVTSAAGDRVYATTGQAGWASVPFSKAASGWMEPGFDAASWPEMGDGNAYGTTCATPEDLLSTGAKPMWSSETSDKIAVRFVVPSNKACACTQDNDNCKNGVCYNCNRDVGGGTQVCYKQWTKDACEDAGSGYTWCGY